MLRGLTTLFATFLLIIANTQGLPQTRRAAKCSSYTLINTRGTGEIQGESAGFRTMNSNVQQQISGGTVYNTVYPADFTQNSAQGTTDIINKVKSTVDADASACIILEGYSQGAAATVNAMPKITDKYMEAVKGVVMVGDPEHKSGLACNVDNNGGDSTKDVNGLEVALGSIPDTWISKTLDICIYGDGVCDTTHGFGINMQHLEYPTNSATQNLGTKYIVKALTA